MKVIAGIKCRKQAIGMFGISGDLVEVDHRIEVSGDSDPFVDRLPVRLIDGGGTIVIRSYKGHDGGTDDLDVVSVSPRDHLLVSRCDPPHLRFVFRAGSLARPGQQANVVDAFENDQTANAWLGDHIMIEARQGTRSQAIGEEMVSANAVIEDRQIPGTWIGLQALRQNVGPAVIAVGGGAVAISNGVAKHDDGTCSGRGSYVNSGNEIPVINSFCDVELGRGD
jgi:hypothetical protein